MKIESLVSSFGSVRHKGKVQFVFFQLVREIPERNSTPRSDKQVTIRFQEVLKEKEEKKERIKETLTNLQ